MLKAGELVAGCGPEMSQDEYMDALMEAFMLGEACPEHKEFVQGFIAGVGFVLNLEGSKTKGETLLEFMVNTLANFNHKDEILGHIKGLGDMLGGLKCNQENN